MIRSWVCVAFAEKVVESMYKNDKKVILEMLNTWGSKKLDYMVDEKESTEDYSEVDWMKRDNKSANWNDKHDVEV